MFEFITNIDVQILTFIQENLRSDIATTFWKAVSALGKAGMIWVLIGVILIIIPKYRRTGCTCGIALGIDVIITNFIIKPIVARPRPYDAFPYLTSLVGPKEDFSFPSGHTAAAFACTFVMLKLMPKKYSVPALILAILIALSRVYVGVHYPSDVIGGFFIGLISALLGMFIGKVFFKHWDNFKEKHNIKIPL